MRIAAVVALLSLTGCAAGDGTVEPAVIQLVNGTDLDAFYTFMEDFGRDNDPDEVFTIRDGSLRVSGQHYGYAATHHEFEDYRLLIEFRWGTATWAHRVTRAMNSGIFIHGFGEDGPDDGRWLQSLEVEVIEGGTGDFIIVGEGEQFSMTFESADEMQGDFYLFEEGGTQTTIDRGRIHWWGRDPDWQDVFGVRGANDVEHPAGEWNEVDVLADGDTIVVHVNGVLVNRATRVRPRRGKIAVQSELAEVFIRRMDLYPLR